MPGPSFDTEHTRFPLLCSVKVAFPFHCSLDRSEKRRERERERIKIERDEGQTREQRKENPDCKQKVAKICSCVYSKSKGKCALN